MSFPARREAHGEFITNNCENLGLAIEKHVTAIDDPDDKNKTEEKNKALQMMATFKIPAVNKSAYTQGFERWVKAVNIAEDTECFEIISRTRVLLGTGNASVFEFGFNLNHPWGVPYIPGSSLKGLLSSYFARHDTNNWHRNCNKDNPSIKSDLQVLFFGGIRESEEASYSGFLRFHDAWLLPEYTGWFEPDIINTHHQSYYRECNAPDGTENPIPVKIAALRPGLTFKVCIQGPKEYREFAKAYLLQALDEEGIGGKSAVGYGRYVKPDGAHQNLKKVIVKESPPKSEISARREMEQKQKATTIKKVQITPLLKSFLKKKIEMVYPVQN